MKPILEIAKISKRYRISHQAGGYLSLRERLASLFHTQQTKSEDFWALKDVSLNVNPGESLGIIGRNGAGKSTLLKILSRITPPTQGRVLARGRIASLLEVGTGFHPELTGRENVFFNGSLLGMQRKEIETKFDEIIDFSGVENFLDTPLKHYSSGMQLRLAFAVAAFLEPEILIIDEVLAVGDVEFQKKCLGKMEDVSRSGRTILFVSHNMVSLRALCSRGVVLKRGRLEFHGTINESIAHYLNLGGQLKNNHTLSDATLHFGTGQIFVQRIEIATEQGEKTIQTGDSIQVKMTYTINDKHFDFTSCHAGILIYDQFQNVVVSNTSRMIGVTFKDDEFKNGQSIVFTIKNLPIHKGLYSLSYNIVDQNKYLDSVDHAVDFEVESGLIYHYKRSEEGGMVAVMADWKIQ